MVDAQDARGCPVVLVHCKLSVHVFSMLRLEFIGRFTVFDEVYGFMNASGHLLALNSSGQQKIIVYAHHQEGRFYALCRVVCDVGTRWWVTIVSETGTPCMSVGDKDYSTWFVELHPTTGNKVTVRAYWEDQAYLVVHALEDGTLLVYDVNDTGVHHVVNGIKRTILVKATARSSSFVTTLGLPFTGYIACSYKRGYVLETCMRSALRMSLPRHSWMQACVC
jgi:regulation of enolase protein 1 (concanavalin A-like superfamily)